MAIRLDAGYWMLTYDEAIEYLESFINYEKLAAPYDPRKWKLKRVA